MFILLNDTPMQMRLFKGHGQINKFKATVIGGIIQDPSTNRVMQILKTASEQFQWGDVHIIIVW